MATSIWQRNSTAPSASPPAGPFRLNWRALRAAALAAPIDKPLGRIEELGPAHVTASGLEVRIGELCELLPGGASAGEGVPAEVVAFRDRRVLLVPYGDVHGLAPGALVAPTGAPPRVAVGDGLLGRVVGGLGEPLDGLGPIVTQGVYPLYAAPPDALKRAPIDSILPMGVRVLDGLLTCGRGQRIGIFSGAGVGKSTLLGMIARNTAADVNVIALVGERSCEVKKFIDQGLGAAGLARSVVVLVPSSAPAVLRARAAFRAMAIAEYFRDRGSHVLFMMDSLTRFAQAQRDVGLAAGELPSARGFTPSVFNLMPQLLERSGTAAIGSITGLFTVLVEGDDINEPVSDAARSLLDGHVLLSRKLFAKGWFPAVDVPASVSRMMIDLATPRHHRSAERLRSFLAAHAEVEDLVHMGEYQTGANAEADFALARFPQLRRFLQQDIRENTVFSDTVAQLEETTS